MGRLRDIDVAFFELAQHEFRNYNEASSLLLVTKCEKGWVEKNVKKSEELRKALENCHGNYLEFDLYFDYEHFGPDRKQFNRRQRKESIQELVQCVNRLLSNEYKLHKLGLKQRILLYKESTFTRNQIFCFDICN